MVKEMLLPSAIELSQHLSSKICHDYANSISTIDNCAELIDNKNKDISQKAKDLLKSESNYLVLATNFYRLAYGASNYGASNDDDKIAFIDLFKYIKDFLSYKNIKLDIKLKNKEELICNEMLKIIMTISDLFRDNLFSGGDLLIESKDDGKIRMIGYSDKQMSIKEKNFNIIKGESSEIIGVTNCREHYLNILINESDYNISISHDEKSIEYNIKK